jgi:hypothetical protein
MEVPVILLLAGCVSGFLAGFFGVGGGIILVPFLLVYFELIGVSSLVATHLSFGTSLFVIIFASLSSAYQYSRNDYIIWKAVFIIGLGSIVGAGIGSMIAGGLEGKTLQRFFAVIVVIAVVRLLSEQRRPKGEREPILGIPGLAGTGLVVGVLSSLAGIGGGIFSIPIMYTLLHFSMKRALGTSSATIVITAVAGAVGYAVRGLGNPLLPSGTVGYVDFVHALPLIVGTIPLATVGARVASRTKSSTLRQVFAALLLIVAFKMFFL